MTHFMDDLPNLKMVIFQFAMFIYHVSQKMTQK